MSKQPGSTPDSVERKRPYTLQDILQLKLEGWSERKIGAYYGKSGPCIHKRLKGIWRVLDREKIEAYRAHRVPLLSGMEAEILEYMRKPETLAKASVNNLAYTFSQLHTARRLEEGQSTANIALHSLVEQIEREGERRSLASSPDKDDVSE